MKEKVYCCNCKHLGRQSKHLHEPYLCFHPENRIENHIDTWLRKEVSYSYRQGPEVRNLYNDCKLYEEKEES